MKYFLLILLTSCAHHAVKMHTIDHQGLSETIQESDRLAKIDLSKPQPFQKIFAIYDDHSRVTSYYPSGQIRQSLDVKENRAYGTYREWHPNGQLKLQARVIGGQADIDLTAVQTYIFDGTSRAWTSDATLEAEITYQAGTLHGTSRYGSTVEIYHQGLLDSGTYDHPDASITSGSGIRYLKTPTGYALHTYQNGIQEGPITAYEDDHLVRSYSTKNQLKHGKEIAYYPDGTPKFSLRWHEGQIEGIAKTWYSNGQLESQRELLGPRKHGHTTAYYPNGSLMLVEEYKQDKLIRGEYFAKGKKQPVSTIASGQGIATLYDPDGHPLKKVTYLDGIPRNN